MAARSEKLMIGKRLKVLRSSLGLTQAQMAAQLDVSASYITLIEADQRPASAALLMRLAQVFDMNIQELAPGLDPQLTATFKAVLKDPALDLGSIPKSEIDTVLQSSPKIAQALVRLHSQYTELVNQTHQSAQSNPVSHTAQSRPVEKVHDWLYAQNNYVDVLDRAAEELSEELHLSRDEPHLAMTERLKRLGIRTRILPAEVMGGALRRYDPHSKSLMFSELLTQSSRRFQVGVLIAKLEYEALIEDVIHKAGMRGGDIVSLARITLANYFAAALAMPYGRFLEACEKERYDVELLGHRFGASYEQTAHRMCTLQRAGAKGVPFFFVRIDRAGNVSKRFSAGRFPVLRVGGTCPQWNIHAAFETPDQIHTQIVRMPEGAQYISIARTVTRARGTYGAPAQRLAIGLGCDVSYAPRLVYADPISLEGTEPVNIGLNCYLCEQQNCPSRAQAPINRRIAINERERSLALFEFEE